MPLGMGERKDFKPMNNIQLRPNLDEFPTFHLFLGDLGTFPANHTTVRENLPPFPSGYENFQIVGYGIDAAPLLEEGGNYLVIGVGEDRWTPWTNASVGSHWIVATEHGNGQQTSTEPPVRAAKQWSLIVGSDTVGENIEEAVRRFVDNPENLPELVADLDEATRVSNPEEVIGHWIDREPSLMAIVEFGNLASVGGVNIEEIAESSSSISEIIIKATAGVMLRGGMSDHFRYLEDGTLVIDPSSPPSLEEAYELIRRTLETKETASKLENYSAWMLGMIADQCEGYFGDRFDPSMIMAATSRAYNTYICALRTFRSWWTERRDGLTYTHHREVEYAKHLTRDTASTVLDLSQEYDLTVLQQRKLISYAKRFDINQLKTELEAEPEVNVEHLMERLDIRAVNRRFVFFLRSTNRWYEYKGPFEAIPNGAFPIINIDSREIMQQDGRGAKPEEWVPEAPQTRPAPPVADDAGEPAATDPEPSGEEIATTEPEPEE